MALIPFASILTIYRIRQDFTFISHGYVFKWLQTYYTLSCTSVDVPQRNQHKSDFIFTHRYRIGPPIYFIFVKRSCTHMTSSRSPWCRKEANLSSTGFSFCSIENGYSNKSVKHVFQKFLRHWVYCWIIIIHIVVVGLHSGCSQL